MNLIDTLVEFGGLILGLILTLFIFSYVYKDNPLYKFAVHLLVGVSAGFAVVVAIREIIGPVFMGIVEDPADLSNLMWLIPIFLGILLLTKSVPRLAGFGNSSMAVLVGVGAAVGLAGAIMGTLLPQIMTRYENGLFGIIGALLTICTLVYFFFTIRLDKHSNAMVARGSGYVRGVGRAVITVTLAAVFAGLLATSAVLLTSRIGYFIDSFKDLFETLIT